MPPNSKKPNPDTPRPLPAKLIFNPASGNPAASPAQLTEILYHLQSWNILPEVYLVQPESQLQEVARDAIRRGIKLIIVCGGDGTIDSVMGALVGTSATLGILPKGTQNNIAHSLGIPVNDVDQAVSLLRLGQRLKIDVGRAHCGSSSRWFLEAATVGLLSALYPAADDIQHGDLVRIGDFLATLITWQPAEIHLRLNGSRKTITTQAHMVLVSNMPYIGAQFQLAPDISYDDSLLDVFIYANLNKLDLINYAVQATSGIPSDPRIQHYRVRRAVIETIPPMPVMADGVMLDNDPLVVTLRRQALAVMAGSEAHAGLVARSASNLEAA